MQYWNGVIVSSRKCIKEKVDCFAELFKNDSFNVLSLFNHVLHRKGDKTKELTGTVFCCTWMFQTIKSGWAWKTVNFTQSDSMFLRPSSWLWFGSLRGLSTVSKGDRLMETCDMTILFLCKVRSWYSTSSSSVSCEISKYESSSPSPTLRRWKS